MRAPGFRPRGRFDRSERSVDARQQGIGQGHLERRAGDDRYADDGPQGPDRRTQRRPPGFPQLPSGPDQLAAEDDDDPDPERAAIAAAWRERQRRPRPGPQQGQFEAGPPRRRGPPPAGLEGAPRRTQHRGRRPVDALVPAPDEDEDEEWSNPMRTYGQGYSGSEIMARNHEAWRQETAEWFRNNEPITHSMKDSQRFLSMEYDPQLNLQLGPVGPPAQTSSVAEVLDQVKGDLLKQFDIPEEVWDAEVALGLEQLEVFDKDSPIMTGKAEEEALAKLVDGAVSRDHPLFAHIQQSVQVVQQNGQWSFDAKQKFVQRLVHEAQSI
ncbi:hypothetical protein WJX72_005690 [[Myrmecia] bisecta]|uniref:Uncharacterized protein n=1 Tax=[Myrmecia] bisecta TaxID=41462 RepID=A0AAW1Q6S1_9CHLO